MSEFNPDDYVLVVVHPFGDFQRGDRIEDPAKVAEVLAGENARDVHKVAKQA